jgi:16S rRNA (adenine1518-N6/adenine1519-N6)-dimethyltransferase
MIPLDVPRLLRDFNLRPKRRLGQNFLVDESALARVAAAAEIAPEDTVLEIGPGLGSLTRHLAGLAARVVAVEVDTDLLPALSAVLAPHSNVTIIAGDILNLDLRAALGRPASLKVAANIPYYITSAVIRRLLEAEVRPASVVLTVQREVAERICASPGEMSLLAVSVQYYSRPRVAGRIPAGAFYPRPQVDSSILRLEVLTEPAVAGVETEQFFRVAKAGFGQKRKQLHNALKAGLGLNDAETRQALVSAGVEGSRRAETLSLAEWGALARVLSKK